MFDPKQLEELAQKLYAMLPGRLQDAEHELQQKFHAVLQSTFNRLNLVTREEFDVQIKVLARTREKVEALQHQVNRLLQENNTDS